MATRAVEKGFRLIPVLLADAEMPAFLASRVWIDFRDAYGPEYEKKIKELERVLKGRRRERPSRNIGIIPPIPPKGDGFQPEGPIHRTLRIGKERVKFVGGKPSHCPRVIRQEDENRLYELEQLGHGDMVYREKGGDSASGTLQKVERIIGCAGASLTRAHLGRRERPFAGRWPKPRPWAPRFGWPLVYRTASFSTCRGKPGSFPVGTKWTWFFFSAISRTIFLIFFK